jgi:1-acyl-sn-glycerol-3-phosphate acyltransferase
VERHENVLIDLFSYGLYDELQGMKILKLIYSSYAVLCFIILFFIFIIPLMIPVVAPKRYKLIGAINRYWAKCFFFLLGIPIKVQYHPSIGQKGQYIFCPNHFSYFDIPSMGLTRNNAIFVGKSAMEKIPLFGYMYKKLHITVDRNKLKSRYETYIRSKKAIDDGKNLVIFPEGGIASKNPPQMARFKDGAFRIAIEKQIPVVPVTIVNNWIILPENLLLSWKPVKIIFHRPIETKNVQMEELDNIKAQTFDVINQELQRHFRGNTNEKVLMAK